MKIEVEDKSKWKLNFSSADIDDKLPDLISELDESQESILNIIILESILMQVKYNGVDIDKFKKQFIETIIDKCPPVENNKANYNNGLYNIFIY